MAERSEQDSDGSDFEIENELELEEIPDIELYDGFEQMAEQIFAESEGEEEEFAGFMGGWRGDDRHFQPRQTRDYRRQSGLNLPMVDNPKASDFFYLFWDETMWRRMVIETNRYREQQVAIHGVAASAPTWRPVTEEELKTFVGLCLMMGVIRLPNRHDYWRTKESCWLAHTNFGKAMARNRFDDIWRYIHLQDTSLPAQGDKLFKLRWFLNRLCDKYQRVYTPGPTYTVDETMIKFKGRLQFRQYLPMKPVKWGVKVWCLAESTTGYVANFQVYTGRDERRVEHGLSHLVVMDMCVPVQGSQAQVYFDNFFTSSRLLKDLKTLNIQACGTVRQDRCHGVPSEVLPKTPRRPQGLVLERHQYRVAQSDDLTLCHWQDTKPVLVMSNFHDPTARGEVQRTRRNGTVNQPRRCHIPVPACLADYQKHMKGVDLADQMTGYYKLNHRSWKWWRRLFFHQLLTSVYNAYIVAGKVDPTRNDVRNFQDFVEAVAHQLVTTVTTRKAPVPDAPRRATLDHKIEKIFQTRKVCKECARKACHGERRPTTQYGCVQCQTPCHPTCLGDHIRHHTVVTQN